ncbi:MAG: hypothetical protein ACOX17_08965 [Christensenellales bacterium]
METKPAANRKPTEANHDRPIFPVVSRSQKINTKETAASTSKAILEKNC